MKRLFIKTVLATVALAACGFAAAQERSFKFALQNPKGHPLEVGAQKFAELVAAKSGGKMKVNVFAGGTLGGPHHQRSGHQLCGRRGVCGAHA